MQRRKLLTFFALGLPNLWLLSKTAYAKTYMSPEQAQTLLWGDTPLTPQAVTLTREQAKRISKVSKTRVRNLKLNAWRSSDGGWFIVDQVIGKHENIDVAVALSNKGKVIGLEVLVYRESYGHQIMHPKWRAQFHGRNHSEHLKLDKQIKNISGATLSCRHITDGINRLTQTWQQVLSRI
jgi:Na+-translocating ferredoxin:NAD+ oxidoreductase RnfG subunit